MQEKTTTKDKINVMVRDSLNSVDANVCCVRQF